MYVCVLWWWVGVAKLKSSNPGLYDTPHILQSRRNIPNLSTEQESADFSQKYFNRLGCKRAGLMVSQVATRGAVFES